MSSGGLGNGVVWLRFEGVDEVGEEDTVVDEENGDVDADDVVVSLVGIEPRREPVNIAGCIGAAALANDGREPNKRRGDLAGRREERSGRDVGPVGIAGKVAVNSSTTSMDNTLGDLFRRVGSVNKIYRKRMKLRAKGNVLHVRGQSAAASVAG